MSTFTQEDLQELADVMTAGAGVDRVHVRIKAARRGYGHPRTRRVTVPRWALDEADEYVTYYLVHEVCHVLVQESRHGARFQAAEARWLAAFGMEPVYHGVYVRALRSCRGVTLWSKETSKHLRPAPWWLAPRRAAAGQAQKEREI
jgi:hypothetical protein